MQTFYFVLEKNAISIFGKDKEAYERLYIEGNPEYTYDIRSAKKSMDKLLLLLMNEYNLNSIAEINLVIIKNEDKIISEIIQKALADYIKEEIEIEKLINMVLKKLSKDAELLIPQYGINFDGKNYLCREQNIQKSEFSLLGYTLSADKLMKYV